MSNLLYVPDRNSYPCCRLAFSFQTNNVSGRHRIQNLFSISIQSQSGYSLSCTSSIRVERPLLHLLFLMVGMLVPP